MLTQGQADSWDAKLGDLALWYAAFEQCAASPTGNAFFHGPHVAPPVDLDTVRETLDRFTEKYRDVLEVTPLPTLEQLRAELAAPHQPGDNVPPEHDGSPCHNFWHWLHGGS